MIKEVMCIATEIKRKWSALEKLWILKGYFDNILIYRFLENCKRKEKLLGPVKKTYNREVKAL